MNLRLFPTPLLAATLLLSTLGCAKKDDPATPAAGTGSYKLDGTAKSCRAAASLSAGSIGSQRYDFLDLSLTTTPQPGAGAETLILHLYKVPGAAASTYQLNNLGLYTKGNSPPYTFAGTAFALTATSEGGVSGTFSAVVSAASSSIPGPYTTLAAGIFTDVRP